MKLIKGYWTDENNNSWNSNIYSEEQAIKFSKTMINCINCINCRNCINCINCRNCINCINCSDCSGCSYCNHCSDCSGCSYWKENPERVVSPKIGSRNDQTTVYFNSEKTQVLCGCFQGTLVEFENAVLKTHGNTGYGRQYLKFINKVKKYMEE